MAKNTNKKSTINPIKVGLAGTAVVAAGVAAVALSKKSNRKKAGKALKSLQKRGGDLRKRASAGLDKVLKEEQKVREKAEILRAKVKNGTAPTNGKKNTSAKKRTAKAPSKRSTKANAASHGRMTSSRMVN